MHHLHLITVGKPKMPWVKEGILMYAERLSHLCDFQQTVLSDGDKQQENERVMKVIEKEKSKGSMIVILDDRGKQFSSTDFAVWLGKQRDIGRPMAFFIGGAYGFDDQTRKTADQLFSLSSMTYPHELAQLMFVEQLYRAEMIGKGSGYHH